MSGCPDCAKYERQIEDLSEKVALLIFELEDLKSKRYKSKKKPPKDDEPKPPPKKKGGLFGHPGWFRKFPERIDKTVEAKLSECPECGDKDLKDCDDIEEHTQEDIVLPKVETTLFRKHLYYCKKCQKAFRAKGENELPNAYIGPVAKAFAVFLKYGIKISDRDIKKIFEKMYNLTIVPSSIVGFRDQLKRNAQRIYDQLQEALKKSSFIHMDETGWRIGGDPAWLWKASTKKLCLTHIDESRGQDVVDKILGKEYEGVLISDFLSAYNKVTTKAKQRCLIHLLRDLKKVIVYWQDDEEALRYCRQLKGLLENSIQLYKDYQGKVWDSDYCEKREFITQQLLDFQFPNPSKKILQRFVKRLTRHKKELFTFLYEKNIDYHNNHAEQQIRPDVIFRKITFGNCSDKGAQTHAVVMSILQTAKLNNLDPIETLTQILLPNKKDPLYRVLAGLPCRRDPPLARCAG